MKLEHGGNLRDLARSSGLRETDILDFSANINPLGAPEWFRSVISANISALAHYPDPFGSALVDAAAKRYGADPREVLAGNGSTEIIRMLPFALGLRRAVIVAPCYSDYAKAAATADVAVEIMLLREDEGFRLDFDRLGSFLKGSEMVFLGQPNNPTGLLFDPDSLRELASAHPSTVFVIDEAFGDFVDDSARLIHDRPPNVIVLCSLTKFYAMPGLRLGCALADEALADKVRRLLPPWSVNTLAQAVGARALADKEYAENSRAFMRSERERLAGELEAVPGLTIYPGEANFLMMRLDGDSHDGPDAPELARRMLQSGVAIRVCDNFEGLDERYFRVAVRTESENARMLIALRAALRIDSGITHKAAPSRKTPAIMFQGTGSNAGKSVLTAAMCRILLEDGYRVAPFKSQNMSLNSFVTRNGEEMGRAQVVQAQACRLDPDVRMNPILLKPNSDTGSQVIIDGKPVGNMDVDTYINYKPTAFDRAKESYDSLAEEYDVIVLEGAGSPAEVNLKHHDIVNMNMGKYAGAPVLLVGDIDRGGVFASFVGTMEVLAEWERDLVAGFIINRFRGDARLLDDALEYTLAHTGKPILGVVPFVPRLGLPQEDSVEFKSGALDDNGATEPGVEIAVIDLPHISNFTDFDPLGLEPDVGLNIVRSPDELGRPDAVIIPGSKNVIGDLAYLKKSGLDNMIAELASGGACEIVGVCGGFQMLGGRIADPARIESESGTAVGLKLLPLETVFAEEKTLTRIEAKHVESGLPLRGYEIHHGRTGGDGLAATVIREDGSEIGVGSGDGRIWGTYLHGLFDADEFRRWFIDRLRARKGLPRGGRVRVSYDLEPAFDRLAGIVRESMKIDDIYRLMGL
jgi:cobyric acid synthase CobQ/L-threonine-O-3-phosphate decarboxylase